MSAIGLSKQTAPTVPILALAILVTVAAGIVYSVLFPDPVVSLHPVSALGYLVFASGLLHSAEKRRSAILCLMSAAIIVVSVQRILEATVPGWFQLLTAPPVQDWTRGLGFSGSFSTGTALVLTTLHLSLYAARSNRLAALLALGAAWATMTFDIMASLFSLILWSGELPVYALSAMMFACVAQTYVLRDAPLLRPIFSRTSYGFHTRILVVGAQLLPWGTGLVYLQYARAPQTDLVLLELAFAFIGWAMLALVLVIGQLMESRDKALKRAIRNDPLIRLRTREGLSETFKRLSKEQGVILFDLDHIEAFYEINGAETGDQLLRDIARSTSNSLRHNDILARWGGWQFLAVLTVPDEATLAMVAERLRALIASLSPEPSGSNEPNVTASFGVSMVGEIETNIDHAAKRAEEALWAAKALGQDRVVRASSLPVNDALNGPEDEIEDAELIERPARGPQSETP